MEKRTICFNGRNTGHISENWPGSSSTINNNNNNNNKRKKPSFSSSTPEITFTQKFPPTYCRCGGGFCIIKLIPRKNQHFYSCPNKYEMHCGYFKWCHELKKEEILTHRQPPYPCCSCGAGICRLETERQKPFIGHKYFACRIAKGHGACNFRQWKDANPTPEESLVDGMYAGDNTHRSPLPSPNSPLDVEALGSMNSRHLVVQWW
ncbi:uncharacterized protein LOC104903639 isoform X2 [Beta vulgaris subsp. vulgaris]|uniref:uncharacterized protein LOC104903639 isoform X2 n=1 Tax=Beta vulgaris subsp. vulgaris TaxID=3555 RepID=UPI0020373F4F|nr:uncharacterized protein LOC104903639 isoform X2 [Beta vulgaris subsp. vulgaris]